MLLSSAGYAIGLYAVLAALQIVAAVVTPWYKPSLPSNQCLISGLRSQTSDCCSLQLKLNHCTYSDSRHGAMFLHHDAKAIRSGAKQAAGMWRGNALVCKRPSTHETVLVLQGEGCECQGQQGTCQKLCCCRPSACDSQATCSVPPGPTLGEQLPSPGAWLAQLTHIGKCWSGRRYSVVGKAPRRWYARVLRVVQALKATL